MIVYVVTTYSELGRKVKAVFEDRDQAIFCCALLERDDAEMEEWDTEAIKTTGTMKPLCEWTVFIRSDGTVFDIGQRYTFKEVQRWEEDTDGSGVMRMTLSLNVSEDTVKEIALEHWERMKK